MARRLIPTIITFTILMGGYLAYDSFAVPALHGPPAKAVATLEPAAQVVQSRSAITSEAIQALFPPDSWERTCEIMLRNKQMILFVGGYQQLDDHRLEIAPCTIVVRQGGLEGPPDPERRLWLMHARQSTILQMEKEADIRRGSLGRIVSAYIPGEVTIQGKETTPGANDQIELVASHLQVTSQQIWTPHDVRFRYGKHYGSGRDLTIKFSDLQADTDMEQALPAGLRSIELVNLNRLHLDGIPRSSTATGSTAFFDPLEVSGGGTLNLDLLAGLAKLEHGVRLERFAPGGRTDVLNCDILAAKFLLPTPGVTDDIVQLQDIDLMGAPIEIVSSGAGGEGGPVHRLITGRMQYDVDDGQVVAAGGRIRSQFAGASSNSQQASRSQLDVSWKEQLLWETDGREHRLQLTGSTECRSGPHAVSSDRLQVWFDQPPNSAPPLAPSQPPTGSPANGQIQPRRIIADGHVRVETDKLRGETEKLDVVVRSVVPTSDLSPMPSAGPQLNPPTTALPQGQRGQATEERLEVYGRVMRLALEKKIDDLQLRDVTIDGNVRCMVGGAVNAAGQNDSRMEMHGQKLELRGLDETKGFASITGRPAKIRGRGMDISGSMINLDRQGNRLWIEGAGTASLPLPQSVARKYPREAAFATVNWQDGMSFDGRTIHASKNVSVRGPTQIIRCSDLRVALDSELDFSETDIRDDEIELERLAAMGGVRLENRSLNERGLESIDTAAVAEISIEYPSTKIVAVGPGWIESIRMGKSPAPFGNGGQAAKNGLNYLRVHFQKQMQGNLDERFANFSDQIRATYGPVSDWKDRIDAAMPQDLVDDQLLMSCDQLSVFQLARRAGPVRSVELVAKGNVAIEGNQFAARAGRVSYDQGKGLFVMDASGRSPAKLWRSPTPGAPRQEFSAQKFRFQTKTGAVHVDGMQSLDFRVPPKR